MDSIFYLFLRVASIIATLTLFLPIITSVIGRRKKTDYNFDMRLFEVYLYLTLLGQLISHTLSFGFGLHNVIVFRLYLPLHAGLFSFLLIKWAGSTKNVMPFVFIIVVVVILGDYLFGDPNYSPDFMFWSDAIFLLMLSFYLSYKIDKNNIRLKSEFNFIHMGIYLYSIITIIGISPSGTNLHAFGFILQAIAIIVSNIFFARSFKCLYQ